MSENNKKPLFMYEDLLVTQIDLVDKPATGDTFLIVRSEDGKQETVPIIRSSLTGIVDNNTFLNSDEELNDSKNGETQMATKLTEIVEKLSESTAKLEHAASLFADVIKTQEVGLDKVEAVAPSEDVVPPVEPTVTEDAPTIVASEEISQDSDVLETQAATEPTVTIEAPTETISEPVEGAAEPVEMASDTALSTEPIATVETLVASTAVATENVELVAMRSTLEQLTNVISTMSDNFTKVHDRLSVVERSMAVPNTHSVDETHEVIERSKTPQSVFCGLIKA